MKGLIFVELVAFMEQRLGEEITDRVIEQAALPNDGAFTSVGNYPSALAGRLVAAAAQLANAPTNELGRQFGHHLFKRFQVLFPQLMQCYPDARSLLEHVQGHIHEEVRAIYPDAEPPRIDTFDDNGVLCVSYRSHRNFAAIALGLVEQCIASYGDPSIVEWCRGGSAHDACFVIRPIDERAA